MANKESAMFRQIMQQLHKTDSAVEKLINERVAKETANMGLVGKALAASRITSEVEKEYMIATKGITGERTKIFKMLGINLSSGAQKLFEKKATKEEIEKARKLFDMDKKSKDKTTRALSKPLSLILRYVLDTKKDIIAIKSLLTKPKVKANFVFDPSAAGGGRFRNLQTGRLAKASEATEGYGGIGRDVSRTAALTKAIMADEDPMIALKDSMDNLKESIDRMNVVRIERKVDALSASISPTLLGIFGGKKPLKNLGNALLTMFAGRSVHDKLDILMASSGGNIITGGRGGGTKPKPRGTIKKGPGIGGALAAASGAYLISEGVGAAGGAVGMSDKAVIGTQTAVLGAAGAFAGAQAIGAARAMQSSGTVFAKRWKLFLRFFSMKNPRLYKVVVKRLVAVGAGLGISATGVGAIPGLISALINAGLAAFLVYDIIDLWREFNAIPDEKVPTAPTPAATAAAPTATPTVPGGGPGRAGGGTGATIAEMRAVSEMGTAKEAMEFFVSRGYSKAQAAGIVGNLLVESNLKTNAVGDRGQAYGIAQWHADRQALFLKQYGKPIQQSSFKEQLEFVDWEFNNTEAKAKRQLQNTQGATQAALAVDMFYERSAGLHVQKRSDFANQLFASDYADRVEAGRAVTVPDSAVPGGDGGPMPVVAGFAAVDTSGTISPEAAVSAADYDAGKRSAAPSIPEAILKNILYSRNEDQVYKAMKDIEAQTDPQITKMLEDAEKKNALNVKAFAESYVPVVNTLTDQMVEQSRQLDSASKETPKVIMVNNAPAQQNQQPIEPPKQPLPEAKTGSSDLSYMMAHMNESFYGHPTGVMRTFNA